VQDFAALIEDTVREVIRQARQTGEFDMAKDIARPLLLLCNMLGFPLEDRTAMSDAVANLILTYQPARAGLRARGRSPSA
jgi:cytochrome P450